jgi:hypothetical protein
MAQTDEQCLQNYQLLQRSIAELKSGRKPTDDWEQDHFDFFSRLRTSFPDFRELYPGVEDEDYTRWKNNAEQLARYQAMHWEQTGRMNYPAYLQFLEVVMLIVQFELGDENQDNLTSILQTLAMK